MDIEEIKEWHKTSGSVPISEMLIRFDWLIAEVERLKKFEHEYICKRCGIRQNSLPPSDFPAF